MNWYLQVLKKYAVFSGRARRKEYWMYTLLTTIFAIAAVIIDDLLGTTIEVDTGYATQSLPYGYIYCLYVLATFIPGLAVTVRRLHDVGKSGWMFLIAFIPIIGIIWLIVLMFIDSEPGENQYGPNPKEMVIAEAEANHLA